MILDFLTVGEAKEKTNANASMIFVPPPFAADAILEAIDAKIETYHLYYRRSIPVLDMIPVYQALKKSNSRLVGPNCPGVITPDACKIGIMPDTSHEGNGWYCIKSGTLTYEAVGQTTAAGIGQSTCVGIGDPIIGTNFIDVLEQFEKDPETESIVLIGEIGGDAEIKAAEYIKNNVTKPVAAFIAGQTAPKGKTMGHAGAIVSGGAGTAEEKSLHFVK